MTCSPSLSPRTALADSRGSSDVRFDAIRSRLDEVVFWPICDMPSNTANVCFSG
jgi:hypothetical protein